MGKIPDRKDYVSPNAAKCMLVLENHIVTVRKENKWIL